MTAPGVTRIVGGSGFFRFWAYPPNGKNFEFTTFRGVPTVLQSYSSADPFGDSSALFSMTSVTTFDRPGSGDLWWLVPYAKVTIFWYAMGEDGDPAKAVADPNWIWEGYIASEEISDPYQVQCKGALYQADNFIAAPFYPSYPVPYETMISRLLSPVTRPTIGTKALSIEWPSDWNTVVPAPSDPAYLWFLAPFGVKKGAKWTGLTTRDTGSWQALLSGYIQNLLTTMYTPNGEQWTLMKKRGRTPVLRVRHQVTYNETDTLIVYNGAPGTKISLSRDFTQTANVIYGNGSDLTGVTYSGMQVSADGESTWYEPYAALPQVYPAAASNPRYLATIPIKEMRLDFAPGMDEVSAVDMARAHLNKVADPGYSGTISIQSDPMAYSQPFNKFLIQAGQSVMLKNFRGADVLFHITSVEVSPEENQVTLTVDSKYRDALTVSEVRARTRDALDPVNLLKPGSVGAIVNDMVKPWSYKGGSGVIPSGGTLDATKFFNSMPANTPFPWTEWTKKYPPKNNGGYYIRVHKKGPKADDRWQDYGYLKDKTPSKAVPIKGAQSASIRLIQVMAVDKNGNLLAIPFHISFYLVSGCTTIAMPMIPAELKKLPYPPAQRYPFFPQAFNTVKPSGEAEDNKSVYLTETNAMVMGWGTFEEPAGYSPSSKGAKGKVTGMLEDEQSWNFDTSGSDSQFDPFSAAKTAKIKSAGQIYAMVFQDAADDAYFIGRFFKRPDGT